MNKEAKIFLFLLAASFFDCCLILVRHTYWMGNEINLGPVAQLIDNRGTNFLFLIWNLFLAWIPYLLGKLLRISDQFSFRKILIPIVGLLWLLFFPNAPYILTDLFHLKLRAPVPLWYDLIMILSFAWTGLLLGIVALLELQKWIQQKAGKAYSLALVLVLIPLTSLGIFLGRYLRWNSWEVFTEPEMLLLDLFKLLGTPTVAMTVLLFTISFSILLFLFYIPFKIIQNEN